MAKIPTLRRRPPLTLVATLGLALLVTVPSSAMVLSRIAHTPAPRAPDLRTTSGAVAVGNSRDGQAILSATDMSPGRRVTGTVTISNAGDGPEALTLAAEHAVDRPGPLGGRLSDRLTLEVDDITGAGRSRSVYTGPPRALRTTRLGTWPAGSVHTYRFTVAFARDDAAAGADNRYQGSSLTLGFRWTGS